MYLILKGIFHSIFFKNIINLKPGLFCFISGAISSLAFAPIFFTPGIFLLAVLAYHSANAKTLKQAFFVGFYFGFGHFLVGLYWITFALFVYIEDFWWAIPLTILVIPGLMALFTACTALFANIFKNFALFNPIFAVCWIVFEWLRSWLFSGFPWNLAGYSLSFSTTLIQSASIFGALGLSFLIAYLSSTLKNIFSEQKAKNIQNFYITGLIIALVIIFGIVRLQQNPTILSQQKIRLVQPSIKQSNKWSVDTFWQGLNTHLKLSSAYTKTPPDLIIWSETALPTIINNPDILNIISSVLQNAQILITGAISQSVDHNNQIKYHNGMYAINANGQIITEYLKVHLVPFGEYVPFNNFGLIKKLTHGFIDSTPGQPDQTLVINGLRIAPLICYESIFPAEVRLKAQNTDLIINITNDAWYGLSSGPYQHFYIAQMRAIENGIPLVRVANNGISAIIDPLGRILVKTKLNAITYLDAYLPHKLKHNTIYNSYLQLKMMYLLILIIFLAESLKLKWRKIYNF